MTSSATALVPYGGSATLVLMPSHEVDEFYRYPHVKTGYRAPRLTLRECWESLLHAHNQQWNAWTMILMVPLAIIYTVLMVTVPATPVAPGVAALYLLQYLLVCPASALYHVAQAIGVAPAKLLLRVDCFMQMVAAILAQYVMAFYVMNDETTVRALLCTISVTITCVYAVVTLIACREFELVASSRLLMLLGPAVQAIIVFTPVVYAEVLNGFSHCGLWAELLTINIVIGASLWLAHFPERYWPYKHDTTVHSHVVMHLSLMSFQLLQAGYIWSAADEYGGAVLAHEV
jgi:predicted membrane channel-forming protein YqfA (hemolysin III family)